MRTFSTVVVLIVISCFNAFSQARPLVASLAAEELYNKLVKEGDGGSNLHSTPTDDIVSESIDFNYFGIDSVTYGPKDYAFYGSDKDHTMYIGQLSDINGVVYTQSDVFMSLGNIKKRLFLSVVVDDNKGPYMAQQFLHSVAALKAKELGGKFFIVSEDVFIKESEGDNDILVVRGSIYE